MSTSQPLGTPPLNLVTWLALHWTCIEVILSLTITINLNDHSVISSYSTYGAQPIGVGYLATKDNFIELLKIHTNDQEQSWSNRAPLFLQLAERNRDNLFSYSCSPTISKINGLCQHSRARHLLNKSCSNRTIVDQQALEKLDSDFTKTRHSLFLF